MNRHSLRQTVGVGLVILLVNTGYIAAFASPTVFYMANVLAHLVIGVLVAVLYAAATPLFAAMHAQQAQSNFLGALCTLGGVTNAPAQPADPTEGGAVHQQHCVFCVSGAWQPALEASPGIPAPEAAVMAVPPGRDSVHTDFSASLQPLSPRAPPRLA